MSGVDSYRPYCTEYFRDFIPQSCYCFSLDSLHVAVLFEGLYFYNNLLWYFRRLEWCVALINRYLPSHPISWLCCLTSGISSHWDTNTASSCRFGTWNRCFVDLPLEMKFSQFSAIESLFKENFNLVCHCVFGRSWFRDRFNTFHPPPPPPKLNTVTWLTLKPEFLSFLVRVLLDFSLLYFIILTFLFPIFFDGRLNLGWSVIGKIYFAIAFVFTLVPIAPFYTYV